MTTTKEYRILHNNKFIAEGLRYGEYDYTTEENAWIFYREDDLMKSVTTELNLNIAHVLRYSDGFKERYVNGSWVDESTVEQCAECLQYFPITHMTSGIVDKETGLEWYCEKCIDDDVQFIYGNQKSDEEVE